MYSSCMKENMKIEKYYFSLLLRKKRKKRRSGEMSQNFWPLMIDHAPPQKTKTAAQEKPNQTSTPPVQHDQPPPWATSPAATDHALHPLVRLHNEILAFVSLVSLRHDERSARDNAVHTLRLICQALWPECRVEIFGSQATKLAVFCSDIDVVVFGAQDDAKSKASKLCRLASALSTLGAQNVEAISTATVPIVKCTLDGISVDVSFDEASGPRMTSFTMKLLKDMPQLKPLTVVLKYFLAQRALHKPFDGGLGSLATLLTVVSFLQHRHRIDQASGLPSSDNLGALLLEYLQLYGADFDTSATSISIRNSGTYLPKKTSRHQRHIFFMSIENPLQPKCDVTQGSYNMPRVKDAFKHARKAIIRAARRNRESLLAAIINPDDPCLLARLDESNTRHDTVGGQRSPTIVKRLAALISSLGGQQNAPEDAVEGQRLPKRARKMAHTDT